MFPVGALNPQPGNQRRQQLIQALMQQLQRSHAAANTAAAADQGFNTFANLQRKRQQTMQSVAGAASRPAGAGMPGGGTVLTHGHAIPAGLMGGLGAAAPRADSAFMSPMPGVPVPHSIGGTPPGPAPGVGVGGPGVPPGITPNNIPFPTAPAPHLVTANMPSPGGAGGGLISPSPVTAPSVPNYANLVTPTGLVPVAPGMFISPMTGHIYGPGPQL